MNKQIEEKKKLFEDAWKIRSDFEDEDFNLKTRSDNARKQITKLQEEAEKLNEKRPALLADNKDVKKLMPSPSYNILLKNINNEQIINDISVFEKEIIYTLRKMSIEEIANIPDVTEGLENLIKEASNSCNNLQEFINLVKSKRYTQTRIQRILVYALLGITKKDMVTLNKTAPYIRVLGFNSKGRDLLSAIASANPKLNIITSVKKFMNANTNKNLASLLEKDIFATNVYTLGYEYDSVSNLDYTKKLITML